MRHITFRQFEVFEAIARLGSFTRAAEELFLTQPTVSMQIKKLTDTIGLPLFEQIGKKIHLTDAGRGLLHYSRLITQQLDEMDAMFSEMKGLELGRLNISVVSSANHFMPHLLAQFINLHPNIRVNLHIANRDAVIKQLVENSTDLAIMGQPPEGTDMLAQSFMDNPLVVIAAPNHPLTKESAISPKRLAQETFLLREQGSGTRDVMERFFATHRLVLPSSMRMDTNEAIKQSVQAGLGLGIVSLHGINLELEAKRVAILDAKHFPIMRYWHIVHRKNQRLSTATHAFKEFLLTAAQPRLTVGHSPAR